MEAKRFRDQCNRAKVRIQAGAMQRPPQRWLKGEPQLLLSGPRRPAGSKREVSFTQRKQLEAEQRPRGRRASGLV